MAAGLKQENEASAVALPAFSSSPNHRQHLPWNSLLPLVILPLLTCSLRDRIAPWQFMWLLSIAVFLGCKWQTLSEFLARDSTASTLRRAAYLFLWPGMNAAEFLSSPRISERATPKTWLAACTKTFCGAALILAACLGIPAAHPLACGWLGMVGLILFLHFGSFHILALLWQTAGVHARPIMRAPMSSTSLADLWGRRWNLGFRHLTHALIFEPLRKRTGTPLAVLAAFLASGVIHDFVISFPARGGYGRPTAYFVLQGIGVLFEKSAMGNRLAINHGLRGRLFALFCAGAPIFLLFHPPFVRNVMLPFFLWIGSR
jgi:hypothetical protein